MSVSLCMCVFAGRRRQAVLSRCLFLSATSVEQVTGHLGNSLCWVLLAAIQRMITISGQTPERLSTGISPIRNGRAVLISNVRMAPSPLQVSSPILLVPFQDFSPSFLMLSVSSSCEGGEEYTIPLLRRKKISK